MSHCAQSYRKLDPERSGSGNVEAWLSPALNDTAWDTFLRGTPCGQYQQSSLWAEFKAGEGWHHHRVVITDRAGIIGGFQILWKKRGPVRIGYVSKGPVSCPESPALYEQIVQHLVLAAKDLRLSALIIQQPDETALPLPLAGQTALVQSNPLNVIEATYLVDVSADLEAIRRKMNRNVRQCVRKSLAQGMTVRPGTAADLPLFFALMNETCRRQKSAPNPASLDSFTRLWQVFARTDSVEMAFAQRDGHDVAGRMNLIFGNRVTQWKKGWDGTQRDCHPNELLADHALEWAHVHGYRTCDFSAISRPTAEFILAGRPLDVARSRSRDMFNLRLGGYPKLLPRAQLLLPNPVLRWGYRHTFARFEQRREQRLLAATSQSVPLPSA